MLAKGSGARHPDGVGCFVFMTTCVFVTLFARVAVLWAMCVAVVGASEGFSNRQSLLSFCGCEILIQDGDARDQRG